MPNNINANLQIQPGQVPGWTQTQARNNANLWYSYLYTGGSDGLGGMDVIVNSGAQTLHVDLDTDHQRYAISTVSFSDPSSQLSWNGGASGNSINIVDKNDTQENAYYGIFVVDSQANGAQIYCDPMIKNIPPPLMDSVPLPTGSWRRTSA